MLNKKHLILSLSLLFGLLLVACSAPLSPGNQPIEVTDTSGYTTTLEQPPQRVVIAGKAIFMVQDAVYLFPSADERVIGLENRKQSAFDFLPVISDNVEEIANLEMNAGPEQIAALEPDLVLLKNYMAETFEGPLDSLGIPAVYLNLETPETFYRDIEVLGDIFQNQERAEEINQFYQSRVRDVEDALSGAAEDQKPRVLLLEYSDQGGEVAFNVPPASWIQTTLIEKAGGVPVWTEMEASSGWTIVSFEQIAAWDPDQIFLVDYSGAGEQVVAELKADPLWQELQAVQNQKLHAFAFDYYSWDQPDTRWILGLQWLATKIHPGRTGEIDIQEAVLDFYTILYGLEEETVREEILPLLKGDL
jgi:iron complex transport system substrate-binding protein